MGVNGVWKMRASDIKSVRDMLQVTDRISLSKIIPSMTRHMS